MILLALLLGALSGADIAVFVTAAGGLLTGIGGLFVGFRGQNKTDKGNQLAMLLEGYDEIVANLHSELARMAVELAAARAELLQCKSKCAECTAALDTMTVELRKLQRMTDGGASGLFRK